MNQVEFINGLIGIPYKVGGGTPNGFNCWGLARYVQKQLFDRELPDVIVNNDDLHHLMKVVSSDPARKDWSKIETPVHGCLVEMSHGNYPYHVGVFIDIGEAGVLHCVKGAGVCFDGIEVLKVSGWRRISFYEWNKRIS